MFSAVPGCVRLHGVPLESNTVDPRGDVWEVIQRDTGHFRLVRKGSAKYAGAWCLMGWATATNLIVEA